MRDGLLEPLASGWKLDWLVAESLGYKVVDVNDNPFGIKIKSVSTWVMVSPDMVLNERGWQTLLALPPKKMRDTRSEAQRQCDPYSTDLSTALALFQNSRRFYMQTYGSGFIVGDVDFPDESTCRPILCFAESMEILPAALSTLWVTLVEIRKQPIYPFAIYGKLQNKLAHDFSDLVEVEGS